MSGKTRSIIYKDNKVTGEAMDIYALTQDEGRIMMLDRRIRAKQAAFLIGIAESTFWRWVREGRIPQGTRLSKRVTVWKYVDVLNFLVQAERRDV